ncbi:hypothetical protein ACFPM3_15925 [Streptomyces coeruleoprunus]|uniref:Uncharacterized protein n=1 Tax=Streptomyces coeruleoprunus TaxID=285563 RepID=A0ABV9XE97_9ACTN
MGDQKPEYEAIFDTEAGKAVLKRVVDHYTDVFLPCEKKDRAYYRGLTTEEAARSAGLPLRHDGQRHGHAENWVAGPEHEENKNERRTRREASLAAFADELVQRVGKLRKGMAFPDIHAVAEEAAEAVRKHRPDGRPLFKPTDLLRYDAALLLAWHLGVEPEEVWLHSGTDLGVRKLGISTAGRKILTLAELPKPFQELTAWQAEDILCIYKAVFAKLVRGDKPVDDADFGKIKATRQKMSCGHRHCAAC